MFESPWEISGEAVRTERRWEEESRETEEGVARMSGRRDKREREELMGFTISKGLSGNGMGEGGM